MTRALPLLLALLLTACGGGGELRIFPPNYQTLDAAALGLAIDERSPVHLVIARPAPGSSALEAILADEADLTLVENSTAFTPGVRAVLPAYESVLHLMVREEFEPIDPQQPLKGARIHISSNSSAGQAFVDVVTQRQGLTADDFILSPVMEPGQTDVVLYFGPIDPTNTSWYHPGYELIPLDSPINPQHQFYRDGVAYLVPNTEPKVIPGNTYDIPGNEEPLLTVAVDTLLVVRKDLPEDLVYVLTRTLIEHKPRFVAVAPHLFSGITESFDPLDLSFPLHNGARRYLNRDEPGLLERYAESINLLVYIAFLLLTGVLGLARWGARRKKGRVDEFYLRVLDIRRRANDGGREQLLAELDALEQEAFEALVAEKLAADESFRIFTDLLVRVRAELNGVPE
jgi:TRAP-type uncharacterized transport system substrate-binding protein